MCETKCGQIEEYVQCRPSLGKPVQRVLVNIQMQNHLAALNLTHHLRVTRSQGAAMLFPLGYTQLNAHLSDLILLTTVWTIRLWPLFLFIRCLYTAVCACAIAAQLRILREGSASRSSMGTNEFHCQHRKIEPLRFNVLPDWPSYSTGA